MNSKQFWAMDEEVKYVIMKIFLKTKHNIITNTPYSYITKFTDEALNDFLN